MEPFRIKTTESMKIISKQERIAALDAAHQNVFLLDAENCAIDLLTDSGTGAMSTQQWAAMMLGDESYAGSKSWKRFEKTVQNITGIKHILPTHQGRAAEAILAQTLIKKGNVIPNNSHFDTTRANIEYVGGIAVNLLCKEGLDTSDESAFKGNMDIELLEQCITEHGRDNIPFAMITVTNNTGGGQAVSMANIKAVKDVLNQHGIPLVIDCCRFAENAYFIHQREEGYSDKSLMESHKRCFPMQMRQP